MKPAQRFQLAVAALFFLGEGVFALHRLSEVDPVNAEGRKCVFPNYVGNNFISREDDLVLNVKLHKPGVDPFREMQISGICGQVSAQAILDLRLHPVATVLGTLLPAIILAPAAYWVSDFGFRRYQARLLAARSRFKACGFCAERIKAEAKVCRYCGRDVTAA